MTFPSKSSRVIVIFAVGHAGSAFARSRAEPGQNIWQYLRANWLSNRAFETLTILSNGHIIGMREWAMSVNPWRLWY
jgi:hypothetical protein